MSSTYDTLAEVAALRRTTLVSPSQWEGRLADDRPIYIRYRWGELTVRVGCPGEDNRQVVKHEPVFHEQVGHRHGCMIELSEVVRAKGLRLASYLPDAE